MGKPFDREGTVSLDRVTHVIRDGKRYKVDPFDNSPNDLGTIEVNAVKVKTTKGAATKT